MKSNVRCWKQQCAVLGAAMIWLSGCATVSSEGSGRGMCPPVVEYSRADRARAAEEVIALQKEAVIVAWLADYAVIRDQARACRRRG